MIIIYVLVAISVFINRNKLFYCICTMMCVMKRSSIKTKRISDENKSAKTESKRLGCYLMHIFSEIHILKCAQLTYISIN